MNASSFPIPEGVVIRPEQPEEYPVIYELVKVAFATAEVADGDEQDFVERLRGLPGYIPELALVAERGGELVGHLMLTRVNLRTDDGRVVRSLLLAPLAVRLEDRRLGIGAALVGEGLRRAGELGWQAVFLVGNPGYYGRFGFRAAGEFGIVFTEDIPAEFVMGLELVAGALAGGEVGPLGG